MIVAAIKLGISNKNPVAGSGVETALDEVSTTLSSPFSLPVIESALRNSIVVDDEAAAMKC